MKLQEVYSRKESCMAASWRRPTLTAEQYGLCRVADVYCTVMGVHTGGSRKWRIQKIVVGGEGGLGVVSDPSRGA